MYLGSEKVAEMDGLKAGNWASLFRRGFVDGVANCLWNTSRTQGRSVGKSFSVM